jgi:hypothetical protein
MREFQIYDPTEYGMSGSPAFDEAYVLLHDINLDKTYLAYIYTSDYDTPPEIDLDTMQELTGDIELNNPVMRHICMKRNGEVVLDDQGTDIMLSESQNRLLAYPSVLITDKGRYLTEKNDSGAVHYTKDLTLDGITPKKLDMRAFTEAVNKISPVLTHLTHERFGNRYPMFPNAKYYDETGQMYVFVTRGQIQEISDETLKGKAPLYYNAYTGDEWTVNNVTAVCVIDENTYDAWLIKPQMLLEWKEKDPRYKREEER